jgi:phytoene synthase
MVLERPSALQRPYDRVNIGTGIASAADYAVCHQVMRSASKNYTTATAFLPLEKRPHVEALYALLRVGDDRVDVSHNGFDSPLAAIDDWEAAYWRAFTSGDSPHPVMRAYLNTALQFGIPKDTMTTYFRAMREDITITRFPTFDHLLHYMDGSSIPVGRAMTYILGIQEQYTMEEVLRRADALAIAMQLSNFWRDIGGDWLIGRIYIPKEDMAKFKVSEEDIAASRVTPSFIDLMEFEIGRTEGYYQLAREGVGMLASGQWGVMSGLNIYRGILQGIRRQRYDVFNTRAGTGGLQKIGLVFDAWRQVRLF